MYLYLFIPYSLHFRKVRKWLTVELHEMIRVSRAVAYPMASILFCNIGQHGEVLKLIKTVQF